MLKWIEKQIPSMNSRAIPYGYGFSNTSKIIPKCRISVLDFCVKLLNFDTPYLQYFGWGQPTLLGNTVNLLLQFFSVSYSDSPSARHLNGTFYRIIIDMLKAFVKLSHI